MTVANVHEAAHLIAWEAEPQGIEWNSNSFRPWQRVAETHQPLSQVHHRRHDHKAFIDWYGDDGWLATKDCLRVEGIILDEVSN